MIIPTIVMGMAPLAANAWISQVHQTPEGGEFKPQKRTAGSRFCQNTGEGLTGRVIQESRGEYQRNATTTDKTERHNFFSGPTPMQRWRDHHVNWMDGVGNKPLLTHSTMA